MFSFGRKSKSPDQQDALATTPAPAPEAAPPIVPSTPTPKPAPTAPAATATAASTTPAPGPTPPAVALATLAARPAPASAPIPAEPIPAVPPPSPKPAPPAPATAAKSSTPILPVGKLPTSDLSTRRRLRQIRSLKKALTASRHQAKLLRTRFIRTNVQSPPEAPAPVVETAAPPSAIEETIDHAAELAKAPAFVEMQYEIADLRHELNLLRQSVSAQPDTPELDPEALIKAVPTTPAFVELQYEAVDLRNQVDTLQKQLAKVREAFSAFGQG